MTIFTSNGTAARSSTFWTNFNADTTNLGLNWVRTQRRWSDIENPQGTYNWTGLDDDVSKLNTAGLKISFPIQDAPSWALANPSQTVDGTHYLPDPTLMAGFATQVATRYNGLNGHGFIDAIEVGNEDFDIYYDSSYPLDTPPYQPYRDVSFFTPVLSAVSPAIRSASPKTLVGMCAMWWREFPHIQNFMTGIYTAGLKNYFDFANFHFYPGGNDPYLSENSGIYPSFVAEYQKIQSVMLAYGDGAKPIWCTEFGWAVTNVNQSTVITQDQQNAYYKEMLDFARQSGAIQKIFFYTLSYDNDGMTLEQGTGPTFTPTEAYTTLKNYIAQYPHW